MKERRVIHPLLTKHEDYCDDFNAASPHRAGHSTGIHPEDRPHLSDEQPQRSRPQQQYSQKQQDAPRPVQYRYDDGTGASDAEQDNDELYDTRRPSSARRYQMPVTQQTPRTVVRYHRQQVPPRSSRTQDYAPPPSRPQSTQQHHPPSSTAPTATRAPQHRRRGVHWLVPVGLTMITILILWMVGLIAVNWWRGFQDDLHYGRPRTAQYDVRVGHGDQHTPSHFLVVNLNKQVDIIEFPAGDVTKAKVYIGPTLIGEGEDLTPVTLEFRDVNRDGKPDMIVHIKDNQTVFVNENGQFRLSKPSDNISV